MDPNTVLLKFENFTPPEGAYYGITPPSTASVRVNGIPCLSTVPSASGAVFAEISGHDMDFSGGPNEVIIQVFDSSGHEIFTQSYSDLEFYNN